MSELPEPLTPPESDLRGLPYMPLDCGRLCDSDLVALTTGDEFKAAVILWCKSWVQLPAGSLPDDDRVLAHLTGLGPRWKKIRPMALHGWVKCNDGRFYHPVVAEKACEAWKHRLAQRDRANRRWHNDGTPTEPATAHATASPTALPDVMQGKGNVKKKEKAIAFSKTRISDDWQPGVCGPDSDSRAIVDRWQPTEVRRQAEAFRAHHLKNDSRFANWQAAWQTWVLNSVAFDRPAAGGFRAAQPTSYLDVVKAEQADRAARAAKAAA